METKNKGCMDTVMSYCTTFEEKLSKKGQKIMSLIKINIKYFLAFYKIFIFFENL